MKNVFIWGLEKNISCFALKELERQGGIAIRAWFSNAKSAYVDTDNWLDLLYDERKTSNDGLSCPQEIYDIIYLKLFVFMDMLSRSFVFRNKAIHEYLNVFNILLNRYYELLVTRKIELLIFEDAPHDGANYLLYLLAKAMKIPTLILFQSVFPGRFFYVFDLEEYGSYENSPEYIDSFGGINVERKFEKDLFYMKKETLSEKWKRASGKLYHIKETIEKRAEVRRIAEKKYEGFWNGIYERGARRFLERALARCYNKRKTNFFNKEADFDCQYIYFPLHLQPEMTTSSLGGVYCDQLLAIERLALILPENWKIYVKENPKQTDFMRGKHFYERLAAISKVVGVKTDTDTYALIKAAQFVATISGTAGWEAISGGKKVIVFGKAWYRLLPGVYMYEDGLKLEQLLQEEIDHADLQRKLEKILKKTAPGLVNKDYLPTMPGFDYDVNNQQIKTFFQFILAWQGGMKE